MDFKYRWKNGTPPSRDQAAQESSLLDESQFETPEDYQMAENMARKHLNVPLQTADA
ncbi:MAG TPA: bromodomain-containing protein, partial [Cyanobacteria bacterium UBA11162]|nr:bromodomain-containing protein [Cyanobacteria bacterium UBA11162]